MIENKILIVDEDPFTRETTEAFLKSQGYRVQTAGSSKDALDLLGSERFPIVLTALKMSGLNGEEVCKQAKKHNLRSVVYGFSSYLKDFDPGRLESFGFDGHMKKPLRKETLAVAIKGAIDKLRHDTPVHAVE